MTARQIDMARLPEDVQALVAALEPGGQLVVLRDGEPVAAITKTADGARPLEGIVITAAAAERETPLPPLDDPNVTVVATAMKLSESVRAALSAELGADYIVLDMNAASDTVDVLLVPPISPQLIGSLRARFPAARIIVAEIEDEELGISYRGPVRRLLDAGAETYLAASTLPHLAGQLDQAVTRRSQLGSGGAARLELEPRPDRDRVRTPMGSAPCEQN